MRAAIAVVLALGLSLPGVARGAPSEGQSATVAVLPVSTEAKLRRHVRSDLVARVVEGLERGSFTVVEPQRVIEAHPDAGKGCNDTPCQVAAGRAAGATHVVTTSVQVQRKDYRVVMEARSLEDDRIVATVEDTCEVCGSKEAARLVADLAATLSDDLGNSLRPAVLRLQSNPTGASVDIDNEPAGTTPLEVEVDAGPHLVRLELPGYAILEREIELAGGVQESQEIELRRLEKTPDAAKAIPAWPGWALIGVGAGTIIGGITLIAVDESPVKKQCTGDNVDELGNCRFRHNTLPLGIALTVGGVVLGAAGAAILIVRRGKSSRRARVAPSPGGLLVRF